MIGGETICCWVTEGIDGTYNVPISLWEGIFPTPILFCEIVPNPILFCEGIWEMVPIVFWEGMVEMIPFPKLLTYP